jgi:hypothetical protein
MVIAMEMATNIFDKTVNILNVFTPTSLTSSVGAANKLMIMEMNTQTTIKTEKIKFNQEFTECVFLKLLTFVDITKNLYFHKILSLVIVQRYMRKYCNIL